MTTKCGACWPASRSRGPASAAIECHNVRHALEALTNEKVFCGVTDLRMPDLDGLDLCRIVRADARIALEVKYFGGSRWADRAPRMMQQLLIQSFENTKKIVSVGRQSIGLRSDFVLKTELREFQAEKTPEGGTIVRVRMNVKLVRPALGQIVASESFESVKPAESESVPDIVQSFDDAVGAVLKRSVTWTMKAGEENMKKQPKAWN